MNSDFSARLDRIAEHAPKPAPEAEIARARAEQRELLGGMAGDGIRFVLGFVTGCAVMVAIKLLSHYAQVGNGHLAQMIQATRMLFGEIWLGIIMSPTVAHLMTMRSWTHLGASLLGAIVVGFGEGAVGSVVPEIWGMLFPNSAPMTEAPAGPLYPGAIFEQGMVSP